MKYPQEAIKPTTASRVFISRLDDADSGGERAFERLLDAWEPLIRRTAHRLRGQGVDVADLTQIGRIALWRALKGFDSRCGEFSHYGIRSIRNAMFQEIRTQKRQPKTLAFEEATQDGGAPGQPKLLRYGSIIPAESVENRIQAKQWFGSLEDSMRLLVDFLVLKGHTQSETAKRLGVSQPRVSQMRKDLLGSLRGYL